mgnify:CR=1 FL=1
MPKFAVKTLGCKVNQYESECIARGFLQRGFELVDFSEYADVYVINTCMVTNVTEAKSRKIIRRAIKNNSSALIAVTGCYAELKSDDVKRIKGVDLVVGNGEKERLPDLAAKALSILKFPEKRDKVFEKPVFHTRALVKIQDGCDQFCSYCIIPHARGNLKSRDLRGIICEVQELVDCGIKEVVLTGIHLGKFGWDLKDRDALKTLLLELKDIKGLARIRLSSIELKELTRDLISLIAMEPKICKHLHIPLQSGSNTVLRAMDRNYSREDFVGITREIKSFIPDMALTTDIIVGFPGETDGCFQETVSVVKEVAFRKLHVFRFSPRSGTKAAMMSNQTPEAIKESRSHELIGVGEIFTNNFLNRFLGRELHVLVERFNEDCKLMSGFTDNYIKVNFKGPSKSQGQIVAVRALDVQNGEIFGNMVFGDEGSILDVKN